VKPMKHKLFLVLFAVCVITSEIQKGYDEFLEFTQPEIYYSDFGMPISTYTEIQCTMSKADYQHCSCPQFITTELTEDMCPRIGDCCLKDWSARPDDEFGYGEFCSALKREWGEGLLSHSEFSNTAFFGSIALNVMFMGTYFIPDPVTQAIVTLIGGIASSYYETTACYYNHGYYLSTFGVRVNELFTKTKLWRQESVRHFSTPLDSDSSGVGILSAFRICGIPTLYSVVANIMFLNFITPIDSNKINAAMEKASETVSWIMMISKQLFGGVTQVAASTITNYFGDIADETWDDIWQQTNYGTAHYLQKALHILLFVIRKIGYAMRQFKRVMEELFDDVINHVKEKHPSNLKLKFVLKLSAAIGDVFAKWFTNKKGLSTPQNFPEDNPNQFLELIRILKEFQKRTLYLVNRLYCNCFEEKDKDVNQRSKYCQPGTDESKKYHWYFSPNEIHDPEKLTTLTTKVWGKVMGPHFSPWETVRDCFREMEPMQREYIMRKVQGLLGTLNVERVNIPPVLKIENGEGPFVNVFWSCPNNHDPKFAMCQTYYSKEDDSFLKIVASDKIPELCPTKTEGEEQRKPRKGRRFF